MATTNAINSPLSGTTGSGNFVGANTPTLITPVLGVATATSLNFGSNTTDGQIGVTGASSPATGVVGEVISSEIAYPSVALTTSTVTNVTSITLTPGEWLLSGWVFFVADATTTSTLFTGGISATSITLPSINPPLVSEPRFTLPVTYTGPTAGQAPGISISNGYKKVTSNTTMYLVVLSNFAVSTMNVSGVIFAVRLR